MSFRADCRLRNTKRKSIGDVAVFNNQKFKNILKMNSEKIFEATPSSGNIANTGLAAAAGKFKPSKKHLAIFKTIAEKGYYKPTYSDKEPATMTLEKKGIVEWRDDFRGVKLTEYGRELVKVNGW